MADRVSRSVLKHGGSNLASPGKLKRRNQLNVQLDTLHIALQVGSQIHAKISDDAQSAGSPDDDKQLMTWSAVTESPSLVDTWRKVGVTTVRKDFKGEVIRSRRTHTRTHTSSTIRNKLVLVPFKPRSLFPSAYQLSAFLILLCTYVHTVSAQDHSKQAAMASVTSLVPSTTPRPLAPHHLHSFFCKGKVKGLLREREHTIPRGALILILL